MAEPRSMRKSSPLKSWTLPTKVTHRPTLKDKAQ